MTHPHLKKSRDGHNAKLRRMTSGYGSADNPTGNIPAPLNVAEGPQKAVSFPAEPDGDEGMPRAGRMKRGGPACRAMGGSVISRAEGGRTKGKGGGKTNVNIIIAPQAGQGAGAGTPPPVIPTGPGAGALPPHPPMGGPPPGMPPGGPPPGAMPPPGMMPRARGGRVHADAAEDRDLIKKTLKDEGLIRRASGGKVHMTAGAATGEGRLEKIKAYGAKSHMKPQAV